MRSKRQAGLRDLRTPGWPKARIRLSSVMAQWGGIGHQQASQAWGTPRLISWESILATKNRHLSVSRLTNHLSIWRLTSMIMSLLWGSWLWVTISRYRLRVALLWNRLQAKRWNARSFDHWIRQEIVLRGELSAGLLEAPRGWMRICSMVTWTWMIWSRMMCARITRWYQRMNDIRSTTLLKIRIGIWTTKIKSMVSKNWARDMALQVEAEMMLTDMLQLRAAKPRDALTLQASCQAFENNNIMTKYIIQFPRTLTQSQIQISRSHLITCWALICNAWTN